MPSPVVSYDVSVALAVFALIGVAIGATAIGLIIRIKTLSINRRNLYRLATTLGILLALAVITLFTSGDNWPSEGSIKGLSAFLLIAILSTIIHAIFWLFEKLTVRRLIDLSNRQSRARREGRLDEAYRYHRELTFLKRFIKGSIKELNDAGVTI